jgi:hypothetical protein
MCDYDLALFTSLPGSWSANSDGLVTFFDQSLAPFPPAPADYCQEADNLGQPTKLSMTGHNGTQLFNRPDLRSLVFHPPGCSDGMQTGTKEGVDCGGITCKDACACFNGVQDPWEDGVDCGGPCSLLCSCSNGKKDGDESGVDCGGECQKRFSDSGPIECK